MTVLIIITTSITIITVLIIITTSIIIITFIITVTSIVIIIIITLAMDVYNKTSAYDKLAKNVKFIKEKENNRPISKFLQFF
jgi:hypothetical protein